MNERVAKRYSFFCSIFEKEGKEWMEKRILK